MYSQLRCYEYVVTIKMYDAVTLAEHYCNYCSNGANSIHSVGQAYYNILLDTFMGIMLGLF